MRDDSFFVILGGLPGLTKGLIPFRMATICFFQARSSGVEYLLDMQGVGGSKPPVPILSKPYMY